MFSMEPKETQPVGKKLTCLAITQTQNIVIGGENFFKIYSPTTHTFIGPDDITGRTAKKIELSLDMTLAIVGFVEGQIAVFSTKDCALLSDLSIPAEANGKELNDIVYLKLEKQLIAFWEQGLTAQYDLKQLSAEGPQVSLKPVKTTKLNATLINSAVHDFEEDFIFCNKDNTTLAKIDVKKLEGPFDMENIEKISYIKISPDDHRIYVAAKMAIYTIFIGPFKREKKKIECRKGVVTCLGFNEFEDHILAVTLTGEFRLYSLETGTEVRSIPTGKTINQFEFQGLMSLAVVDGNGFIVTYQMNGFRAPRKRDEYHEVYKKQMELFNQAKNFEIEMKQKSQEVEQRMKELDEAVGVNAAKLEVTKQRVQVCADNNYIPCLIGNCLREAKILFDPCGDLGCCEECNDKARVCPRCGMSFKQKHKVF